MTNTRLLITAVVIEKRPVPEVAATYGVSRSWLYELPARYRRETPQFVMRKGDSEVFVVIARAVNGRFQWYIDVRLMVDGMSVEMPALDKGRSFVTVGHEGIAKRWWVFDQRRWIEPPW